MAGSSLRRAAQHYDAQQRLSIMPVCKGLSGSPCQRARVAMTLMFLDGWGQWKLTEQQEELERCLFEQL